MNEKPKIKNFLDLQKSLFEKKSLDISNPYKLCIGLEKELKNLKEIEKDSNKDISIKNVIINEKHEILESGSTNELNLNLKEYDKFKRKNKLLEFIMV